MIPQEIIRIKRDGGKLSHDELKSFFYGYLKGDVADYQVSAMLMAIFHHGMEHNEMAQLTALMRDSGTVLDWPYDRKTIIDKHSTGGVGDKTSLVIMPLAILEGLKVPMISGRGLGHTGGTLDKLESIGINVFPDAKMAEKIMGEVGGVFMGQTEEMVPLDRKLYALRDVTSTVESIPLIVGSILSKKLSEGIGGLVMDIKFGSGAFMSNLDLGRQLAQGLVSVGNELGIQVRALLTSMNSPLGAFAGNGLEVFECIELMNGRGPESTRDLVLALTAEMVRLAQPDRTMDEILTTLKGHLDSGRALEVFTQLTKIQGGDVSYIESPEKILQAKFKSPVTLDQSGFVQSIDTRGLGLAILELGGGRRFMTDTIDPWVGLGDLKHVGDRVEKNEPIATIYANKESDIETVKAMLRKSYSIGEAPVEDPLIVETM
jgi:pyrimidine-nucleoside phosphorylase